MARADQERGTEDLAAQALHRRVRLPDHFVDPVIVERVEQIEGVYLLTVRTRSGTLEQVTLDEAQLRVAVESAADEASLVRPEDLFLLIESARIRLAYAFDPYFAVTGGVAASQFGYVPAARPDGKGGIVVDNPALVRFGAPVRADEIDLSGDAYILSPALARKLLPKPADTPALPPATPPGEGQRPDRPILPTTPVVPGKPAVRYVLDLIASKAQVFKIWPALQNLSDRSKTMKVTLHVEADAQEQFDPVWLRNAVEEPLDEAEIERRGGLQG